MWIIGNDFFLSMVAKDCARDELLVRARCPGDIEKIFPEAKVFESLDTDYRYRAVLKRATIAAAMAGEVQRIAYSNFKSSVADDKLHDAYMGVWTILSKLQPTPPYNGRFPLLLSQQGAEADEERWFEPRSKKKRSRKRRSLTKGI